MTIDDLLIRARKMGASDVHVTVGIPPKCRVNGELVTLMEGRILNHKVVKPYRTQKIKVLRAQNASEEGLTKAGYTVFGGVNAPYIWLKTPDQMTSWDFFDYLLENANVVGTPGSGFGPSGEGYFRLTAFGTYENTLAAMERIQTL